MAIKAEMKNKEGRGREVVFMCAHVCVYEQVCVSIYMCVNARMHMCVSKGLIILESEIHRTQCLKPKPMCFYLPDEKILEKQERGVGVEYVGESTQGWVS